MLIQPEHLKKGDTIGIVSPASPLENPDNIDRLVEFVLQLGFNYLLSPSVKKRKGYLAGSDIDRANDLMKMFKNRKVKAIFCLGGGYGSARLLEMLDYHSIQANSKIFVGDGDITSLHCALLAKSGLCSFYSPIISSASGKEKVAQSSLRNLFKCLNQEQRQTPFCPGNRKENIKVLSGGKVSGTLIGGDLTTICSMVGTPFQPSFKKALFFFENSEEWPYRTDRLLNQLQIAGLLDQVSGIAIGMCKRVKTRKSKEYTQSFEDVFKERLLSLKIPVVMNFPFGYRSLGAALPIGARVTLDGNSGDLLIMERTVR